MASAGPAPIRPLPDDVRACLRSTLNLVSLRDAISELLQNALDAGARTLTVQANLLRNSCAVTDDGIGIPPEQMSLVATRYATSKYPPPDDHQLFGFRGEALASLGTHSLLTLASRNEEYRSTHMIRMSYGDRAFVGHAPEHLCLPSHGTVARVEGLWGNMPVRLKARETGDYEREWEDIKRAVVELLLTPLGKGVGVVLRDENGKRRLAMKGTLLEDVPWDMRVLRQVYGREVGGDGWERVKAKQNGVKVEGWICSTGAGSKTWQFLYINNHPLPPNTTLLHAEVNRIFAASSFGVVEDEGKEKQTNAANKGAPRKGVDRHGKFVLRVEARKGDLGLLGGEGGTEGKAGVEGENLKQVVDLLQKLVYEFLKAHHFRPTAIGTRPEKPPNRSLTDSPADLEADAASQSVLRSRPSTQVVYRDGPAFPIREYYLHDFDARSRAKAARLDPREEEGKTYTGVPLNLEKSPPPVIAYPATVDEGNAADVPGEDPVIFWTDPITNKSWEVNARTGNTQLLRPQSASSGLKRPPSSHRVSISADTPKRLRRSSSSTTGSKESSSWIEDLLSNWKNPTFAPGEAPIPSLSLAIPSDMGTVHGCGHAPATSFTSASTSRLGNLTRSGLQNAEIIAQVDHKYILIKSFGETASNGSLPTSLLVAVDQHAADERIRVEALFAELCAVPLLDAPTGPTQSTDRPLSFNVSSRDAILLRRYTCEFAVWGINYSVSTAGDSVTVHSLPAVAADRCVAEPVLAIEMLRKHVYELDERGVPPSRAPQERAEGDWAAALTRAPKSLVDMVNSRACRSAIMFNDPLTLEECTVLVEKLAQTKFPFMCAHGRPSMVPLVDLEIGDGEGSRLPRARCGFKDGWNKWKQGGFAGTQS